MLDTVHNQGLRLALGAFRTSPVSSLNVEADEPSLWLRREKLSLQYAIRLAKASLDLEISNFKLPCTDFKPFINRYILSKWQLSWDRATFNKLHEIKPVLGKNTIYRSLRREEVVLTRLRIGHTRLTHSYLLKREDQPFCISCNEPFTAKHFLIDCIEFSHVRRQFFQTNDLRYLFENVPADNILFFLKHINLFNKV